MPALNPNNTERWFVNYQVGPDNHTLMMRTADGQTATNVKLWFNTFLTNMAPLLYLTTIVGLDRAVKGSNVRLPQDASGLGPTYGTVTPGGQQSVFGLAFPGRSTAGHKARVYVLPVKLQGDNNYIYTVAENINVSNAYDALTLGGSSHWIGIDGNPVNWYAYATSKQNDHYVGKRRGD